MYMIIPMPMSFLLIIIRLGRIAQKVKYHTIATIPFAIHSPAKTTWQEEPGKPMGQAITKRYLDATAPQAQQLIRWIRKLFDLETV